MVECRFGKSWHRDSVAPQWGRYRVGTRTCALRL